MYERPCKYMIWSSEAFAIVVPVSRNWVYLGISCGNMRYSNIGATVCIEDSVSINVISIIETLKYESSP